MYNLDICIEYPHFKTAQILLIKYSRIDWWNMSSINEWRHDDDNIQPTYTQHGVYT